MRRLIVGLPLALALVTPPAAAQQAVAVGVRSAVVLAPPLEGAGWVAAEGCCFPLTHHRAGVIAINGTLYVAQRFAIDFVQLNANDRLYTGDATKLASYAGFGASMRSRMAW